MCPVELRTSERWSLSKLLPSTLVQSPAPEERGPLVGGGVYHCHLQACCEKGPPMASAGQLVGRQSQVSRALPASTVGLARTLLRHTGGQKAAW